jgi:hypothetical protein
VPTPTASLEGIKPVGINDAGLISGTDIGFDADFLDDGGTFTTISGPLTTNGVSPAYRINDAGQVVGYYFNSGVYDDSLQRQQSRLRRNPRRSRWDSPRFSD